MKDMENFTGHKVKYTFHNKVHFKTKDPYGLWSINLDKGAIAQELQGTYTTYEYALQAMKNWCKNNKEELSDTPIEKPKIEYKTKAKE